MTDRLSPEREEEIRDLHGTLAQDVAARDGCAACALLAELDAVRAELKEERRVSRILNVQNAELMKGPRE